MPNTDKIYYKWYLVKKLFFDAERAKRVGKRVEDKIKYVYDTV